MGFSAVKREGDITFSPTRTAPDAVTGNYSPLKVARPMPLPEAVATDHELILLILAEQRRFSSQLDKAFIQIEADRERWAANALRDQATDLALGTMRQDISRAMLEAAEAKRLGANVQNDIGLWQARFKTLLYVGGPMAVILGGLMQEAVRRLVFP